MRNLSSMSIRNREYIQIKNTSLQEVVGNRIYDDSQQMSYNTGMLISRPLIPIMINTQKRRVQ